MTVRYRIVFGSTLPIVAVATPWLGPRPRKIALSGPPCPATQSVPSGAHRTLSTRKPRSMTSRVGVVVPRESRMNERLPHCAT
jgi:hypothetical protein